MKIDRHRYELVRSSPRRSGDSVTRREHHFDEPSGERHEPATAALLLAAMPALVFALGRRGAPIRFARKP